MEFDHIMHKVVDWVKTSPQELPLPQLPDVADPGTPLSSDVTGPLQKEFPNENFANILIHEDIPEYIDRESFSLGDNIHFKPGKYHPSHHVGQELLGHEIAHVLQERMAKAKQEKAKKAGVKSGSSTA
jgi:hypothetical protein